MKPTIVVTQPIHADVVQRLQQVGHVVMNHGPEPWGHEELQQHLRTAHALMAFMPDRIDAQTLSHAPMLKTIACALKGYDNFDISACQKAGVVISFVPDLLTEPTAELAIGLTIAAARHVIPGDQCMRTGRYAGWRPVLYGRGLHHSVVSVIGLGAVGKAIIDRLMGFGCAELLGVDPVNQDPRIRLVPLEEAITRSDYMILAVPLLPATRHLINGSLLAKARPGLVLVNIGRGSVVDEAAVAHALDADLLGAYAADVFEMEDWLLHDRPQQVHPALLASAKTVLTPHLGSAVARVRLAIEHRAADNLLQVLAGQLPQDCLSSVPL